MSDKEEVTQVTAGMLYELLDKNDKGLNNVKNILFFITGLLADNGYNRIYNIIGDNCGKTTVYNLVKSTVESVKVNNDEITAKPFFIDNGVEYFNDVGYDDFIREFISDGYTALCVDDLGFKNYMDLVPFFTIIMMDKPCFFTMNSENGELLKEKMNGGDING